MDIQPELVCALRMAAQDVNLRATFVLASKEDKPLNQVQVCQVAEDFIRENEDMTGVKSHHVGILPSSQTFSVEGSPLLIRSLIDHGPGVVQKVTLG